MTILPKKKPHIAKCDRPVASASSSPLNAPSSDCSTSRNAYHRRPGSSSQSTQVPDHRTMRASKAKSNSTSHESPASAASSSGAIAGVGCQSALAGNDEYEYNSDDERGVGYRDDELERRFEDRLQKARGLKIKKMRGDGACLFRSVADQVYGDEEMHGTVRKLCLDYMAKNRDHFSQFVTEDFNEYLTRKSDDRVHGNHIELQAISEIYSRPIEIYEYNIGAMSESRESAMHSDPINTFHPTETSTSDENPPLRLSYHGTVHYNSVVDPYAATIGVGLGLPGLKPGLAEKNLMREAIIASETHEIEEAMLKDKMQMSDYQTTEQHISEQVARESYLQYVREAELRMRDQGDDGTNACATKPPSSLKRSATTALPARRASPRLSPHARDYGECCPSTSTAGNPPTPQASSSLYDELSASAFAWDDEDEMLSQVLALSQQEFIQASLNAVNADDDPSSSASSRFS